MYRKSENLKNALLREKYPFSEMLQWRKMRMKTLRSWKGNIKNLKKPEILGHEPWALSLEHTNPFKKPSSRELGPAAEGVAPKISRKNSARYWLSVNFEQDSMRDNERETKEENGRQSKEANHKRLVSQIHIIHIGIEKRGTKKEQGGTKCRNKKKAEWNKM